MNRWPNRIGEILVRLSSHRSSKRKARALLQKKRNLRLIRLLSPAVEAAKDRHPLDCGGVLVQGADCENQIAEMS